MECRATRKYPNETGHFPYVYYSHLWYINVGVVIEAYLVVGGVVGVHDLEAPVEGDQVPLLHLEERLKCELFKRQKCNMFRDMLHLPLGEQALAPLLHLRAKHLAPAALVRIRHLVSSVTSAALASRIKSDLKIHIGIMH